MNEPPLQTLLESASEPILLIGPQQEVLWCNQSAAQLAQGKLKTRKLLTDLLRAQDVAEIMGTQSYRQFEVQICPSPGLCIPQTAIVIDVSPPDPDSRQVLLILKSDAPAAKSLTQREEFLVNVAHDLKNPLGAIFGYADALLDTASGAGLNEKQRDVIARIRSTALRCVDMVKNYQLLFDLHSPALINAGRPSDLNQIAKSVIEYSWRESNRSPKLSLQLAPEAFWVNVERVPLERIVANLFSNAVRYTPPGECITVQSYQEGAWAVLRVNNSRPVIKAEELPHIFERRVRLSTSEGTAGSGLGLFIVKHIVEAAAGSVLATSDEKNGTTFTVKLPLGKNPAI